MSRAQGKAAKRLNLSHKQACMLRRHMLACCKIYVSESRNGAALEWMERAGKAYPEAAIINKFQDEAYNRVGYTLVSRFTSADNDALPLRNAVFSMVKAAFHAIDLELHSGTHPRLGVVDHICFHPLAQASLHQAAGLAKLLAAQIGPNLQAWDLLIRTAVYSSLRIWTRRSKYGAPSNSSTWMVPTFLYGAAHEQGRTLDFIRRELGYFKPNAVGNLWSGGAISDSLQLKPDIGPTQAARSTGVLVVGATRWVDNYNIPIASSDIAAIRRIARRVSGRGGGLASVQAMALAHGEDLTEVACNLLDPSRVGAAQVQHEVERLAREEGMTVGNGYFTDLSQEEIIDKYIKLSFC
ncbi:hypothetical protein ACLOJK_015208 [Asimina triloba]